MSGTSKELVPRFFDKTALTYDKIVNWTTFGKDKYWKREILKQIPQCSSILELACGTGILTEKISKNFPNAKIVGIDVTQSYLDIAKKKLASNQNITFVKQDAEKLNLNQKFDCIVSSYIPKYCNPAVLIKSCLEHLKTGGKIILHDFTYPKNTSFQKLWNLYFVFLNGVGYLIPSWKEVFEELPKLIRITSWLEDYKNEMKNNNLEITNQSLTWETSTILTGLKII